MISYDKKSHREVCKYNLGYEKRSKSRVLILNKNYESDVSHLQLKWNYS